MDASTVSQADWKALVRQAVHELPAHLREWVLLDEDSGGQRVTVQVRDDRITMRVTLAYWDTGHAHRNWERQNRKPDDYVNPFEDDNLDAHGGVLRGQLDWPLISVDAEAESISTGYYPDRIDSREFKRRVQLHVCEALLAGGLVGKRDEVFVSDSGEQVLPWQESDC